MLLQKSKKRRTPASSRRTNTRRTFAFEPLEHRRLLSAGSLDPTFGTGGIVTTDFSNALQTSSVDEAYSVAVQEDGRIVVAGRTNGGATVVRYQPNGLLDSSFGNGGQAVFGIALYATALGVKLQPDGKILVAGDARPDPFAGSDFAVARLLSDGSLDPGFGQGGVVTIDFDSNNEGFQDFVLQSDGKIVVVGSSVHGVELVFVATRLNSDGSLDSSFGSGGKQTVDFGSTSSPGAQTVALQPDGKIVIGGPVSDPGTVTIDDWSDFAIARLNSDGNLDTSFGSEGKLIVDSGSSDGTNGMSLAIQSDGNILLVGTSGNGYISAGHLDIAIARIHEQGALDNTFGNGGVRLTSFGGDRSFPTGLAVQPDGKLVVSGRSESGDDNIGNTTLDIALARFTTDGNFDPTFDGDGIRLVDLSLTEDTAYGLAMQPDGKLVMAGGLGGPSHPTHDFLLARLDAYDFSVVGTASNDTIAVSAGTLGGTLKVTLNGTVTDNIAVSGEVFVAGRGGNDTFTVTAWPAGGLILAGQGGEDSYDIAFGKLGGKVTVADDGSSGTDHLTVRGTPGDDEIFKDATTVTLGNPVAQTVVSTGIETREIRGGGGDDLITDPGSDTALFGDEGNDTIIINATFGGGITADGGEGSDSYQIVAGDLDGPIAISDSGTTGIDSISIVGTPEADTVVQTSTGLILNGTVITFGSTLESATVDGGGGSDQVSSEGTPPVPVTFLLDMVVTGTAAKDHIVINPGNLPGQVVARLNGTIVAQFSPTRRIVVFGGEGDDDIQVAGSIGIPVWLYGEGGDDRLKGGAAADVLIGGDGDDLLVGGSGRDFLIGGAGADRIVGDADDDIIIGGKTDFDANAAALAAIMAEWTSTRTYAQRTANISGTGTDPTFLARNNGNFFLNTNPACGAITVVDDNAADTLTGASGQDWFFANLFLDAGDDANKKDKITDLSAGEFAADLDFILSP